MIQTCIEATQMLSMIPREVIDLMQLSINTVLRPQDMAGRLFN